MRYVHLKYFIDDGIRVDSAELRRRAERVTNALNRAADYVHLLFPGTISDCEIQVVTKLNGYDMDHVKAALNVIVSSEFPTDKTEPHNSVTQSKVILEEEVMKLYPNVAPAYAN